MEQFDIWSPICCPGAKYSYHHVHINIGLTQTSFTNTHMDTFKSKLAAFASSDKVTVDASDIHVVASQPGPVNLVVDIYTNEIARAEAVRTKLAMQYREGGCGPQPPGCQPQDYEDQRLRYAGADLLGAGTNKDAFRTISVPTIVGPIQLFADPHLTLPHGGRADFRGTDGALFNMLSAPNVSLNVKTNDATFVLAHRPAGHPRGGRRVNVTVHGSFLTEAYIVARSAQGHFLNVSLNASWLACKNCTTDGDVYRRWAVSNDEACTVACSLKKTPSKTFWRRVVRPWNALRLMHHCDELGFELAWNTLTVRTPEYLINVTVKPVFGRLEGPTTRLDLQLALNKPENKLAAPPHGIIGQAWDGDDLPISGKLDDYPKPALNPDMSAPTGIHFTTSAMAEGAIEGEANDYRIATPFETHFRFSRFHAAPGSPPRNLTGLNLPHQPSAMTAAASSRAGSVDAPILELEQESPSPAASQPQRAESAPQQKMPDIAMRARSEQLKQQARSPVTSILDPIRTLAPVSKLVPISKAMAGTREWVVGSTDDYPRPTEL